MSAPRSLPRPTQTALAEPHRAHPLIRHLAALAVALTVALTAGLGSTAALAQAGTMDFLFGTGVPRAADGARDGQRVWKFGEFSALSLQAREADAGPNQHPLKVNPDAVRSALSTIEFSVAPGRTVPLFSADELSDLVPALAKALAAAGPGDDLVLFSTARRESGFLGMPQSITARLFAADGALNLLVDEARLDAMTTYRAARIAPKLAFGRRATASKVQIGSAAAVSRRADWLTMAIGDTPRPATLSPAPRGLGVGAASPLPAAAAAPALAAEPAPAPTLAPARTRDARFYDEQAERLKGLQKLRDQGVITEAEYQQKRQEILRSL